MGVPEEGPDGTGPAFDRRIARRFLEESRGFWAGPTRRIAWALTLGLALALVIRLGVDVGINRWNRWFFDALERRDAASAGLAVAAFALLVMAVAAVGVVIVRTRETLQVRWREWWTARLLDGWLSRRRFVHLTGPHAAVANPEYRISDDVRMATEPLTDFAIGLFTAVLGAVTFVGILWSVGGSLTLGSGPDAFTIPAFMVIGAIVYGVVVSCLIPIAGRRLAGTAAARNEAEARFRAEMIRLRENADSVTFSAGETHARAGLGATYGTLVRHWLALVRQHGHVTWVMNANSALVPVVPLLLAAPKYLAGDLSLGQVMQLASAFAQVQVAIGWLVDNYWRIAEWFASARRVIELVDAIDEVGARDDAIAFGPSPDGRIHVEGLRLRDPLGRVLVARADAVLSPGERVVVSGDPGSGKSTLVRALAGLWPWGEGTVRLPEGAKLAFVPPLPFLPPGRLSDAILYPQPGDSVRPEAFVAALDRCGLIHLAPRASEHKRWDQVLSTGERQRLGLVRLMLQQPDIVIMDEMASGLDEGALDVFAAIMEAELAQATVVMVGHRGATARFAGRRLFLRTWPGGAVLDEDHHPAPAHAGAGRTVIPLKPGLRDTPRH